MSTTINLVAFPLSPGGVGSDMCGFHSTNLFIQLLIKLSIDTDDYLQATDYSRAAELTKKYAFPTEDQAAILSLKIIDESTREKKGGQFINIDGLRPAW